MAIGMIRSFASALVGVFMSFSLVGCATEPIAQLNECRSFTGSVENPWKVGMVQSLAGSSNEIDTESSSYRANDLEKIDLFVRPAKIEAALSQTEFNYDTALLERQLYEQTLSSARKWGRFRTVNSESEADLSVQPSMSMLVIEGDAYKSASELRSTYKGGMFGGD
jgi:hypothetical protein